jgi:transcriptional antiterminator NusG
MTADNPDDHPADPIEAVPPHEPGADAVPPEEHAHAESAADDAEHPPADDGEAELAVAATPALPETKHWYIVKVQSGREESIRGALERRVKIEGLEEFFGGIKVPMERVTEMRNGKRVVRSRKKFPGYLMVNVEFNDRILYLFRETSGVGDFVGGSIHRPPAPMPQHEVDRMLAEEAAAEGKHVPREKIKLKFDKGDRVKVRDGTFQGMEGEVKEIIEPKEAKDPVRVRVELTIFGRGVPVEVEAWQVDPV